MVARDSFVLYENIRQCVTLSGVAKQEGRKPTEADLGVVEQASVVVDADKDEIVWVGKSEELPEAYSGIFHRFSSEDEIWIPELVECHTHLIFAGNRSREYAQRCAGKTYQQIAAEGGGILYTLIHTRDASEEALKEAATTEIERFQKYGVGTIEIKSGYGLTLDSELKILRCIQELQEATSVTLVPTFMAAHAVPPEFKGKIDDYVDVICREWIPEVAKQRLAKFVDIFVEQGYFSVDHARKVADATREAGLKLKLHTDQFNDLGATALGSELGATSVDHLDHISDEGIERLAKSKTVGVLLPGASLFTGTPYPPARKLIDAGARIALSTDYNPGTCPSRNLPLMTTIACSQMKMTVAEAIAGITYNAAAALGLEDRLGSLTPGKQFRVCQLKADSYESLPYCFGELE